MNAIFYSGWRPTLYWSITFSVWFAFLFVPIVTLYMNVFHPDIHVKSASSTQLVELIVLALGSTGVRAFEKMKFRGEANHEK